jgi:hypothetical protein
MLNTILHVAGDTDMPRWLLPKPSVPGSIPEILPRDEIGLFKTHVNCLLHCISQSTTVTLVSLAGNSS